MDANVATIGGRRFSQVFIAALMVALAGPSLADTCGQLRSQLASLPGGTGSKASSSQELRKLQTQAKWGGCIYGGPGFFVAKRSPECPQIMARLQELQGGGSARPVDARVRAKRAGILRAMSRNGCAGAAPRDDWVGGIPAYGSYRSLCVRTCDGYYFPISYATKRSLLKVEEAACKSMYFGQDSQLFVQRTSGVVDEARSLKGKRYVDEPFAFQYRDSFDASCVGQLHDGLAGLAEVMSPPKIAVRGQSTPARMVKGVARAPALLPSPRPSWANEDPETQANLSGDFVIGRDDQQVAEAAAVRKVGSAYYYAPRPDPRRFAEIFVVEHEAPPFSLIDTARADELTSADEAKPAPDPPRP